jgi:DNA repair protein RadC
VLCCDIRGQLRGVAEAARGQRSRVNVGATDVMRIARVVQDQVLASGAEYFVVVHNHPSGDPTPSVPDRQLTATLRKIAAPYGADLTFADHVIIGMGRFYSLAEPVVDRRPTWKGKMFKG